MDPSLLPRGEGRDEKIGTRDILYPKQRRYQAAPHPVEIGLRCHCRESLPFHIVISSIDIRHFFFFFIYSSSSRRSYQRLLTYEQKEFYKFE